MSQGGTVIVAGGYGAVGLRLAAALAPRLPGRVLIVGRDRGRAIGAAAAVGHGARAAALDVTDQRAVRTLIGAERPRACIASVARGAALAAACLTCGVHFADVTAEAEEIATVERLSTTAVRHKATAVLSVGLAPGLTNLLARRACSSLDHVERIDLGVRLGLGDTHGPAALAWTLENLSGRYHAFEHGHDRSLRPFAYRRWIGFYPAGPTRASTFNFPEQRTLARNLGVPTVRSWLALAPPGAHMLTALGARTGLARLLSGPVARLLRSPLLRDLPGDDTWAVWVQATGVRDGLPCRTVLTRTGVDESAATAHVAAKVTERLLGNHEEPGVWHVEQLRDPDALLDSIDETLAHADAPGEGL